MRHALTNVVGSRPRTEVHVVEEPLAAGDRLLLTTDGVHGVLDDRRLEGLLADSPDLAGRGLRLSSARPSRAAAATTARPSWLSTATEPCSRGLQAPSLDGRCRLRQSQPSRLELRETAGRCYIRQVLLELGHPI